MASSSVRERLDHTLRGAGLHFEVTIAGDEVEHGKPAPDIFLAAAERLECRAGMLRRGRGFAPRRGCGPRGRNGDARGLPDPGHRTRRLLHADALCTQLTAEAILEFAFLTMHSGIPKFHATENSRRA